MTAVWIVAAIVGYLVAGGVTAAVVAVLGDEDEAEFLAIVASLWPFPAVVGIAYLPYLATVRALEAARARRQLPRARVVDE